MPGSRRCKHITWAKRLTLWIMCTAVVQNWVVSLKCTMEKVHTESSESKMLRCRMLGWIYEITEVQTVFVLLNPKLNILALKTELF